MRALLAGLCLSLLGAAAAPAQTVTQGGIVFDDAKHHGWYVRFWTGSCKNLRVFCLSGAPYWGEIIERLLVNVPAARRERVRARLVVLGQRIGYEWAKENNIRRIGNGDIRRWSADLERNIADPEPAIARLEARVRAVLGRSGPRTADAGGH